MQLVKEQGSAMEEQRKLLDQLMGKTRNAGLHEDVKKRHFTDPDVCKYHLAGLCPYSLFQNTRSDLGYHPDDIEDDEECKKEYDRLSEDEKLGYGYDSKLLFFLRKLVQRCDERIEKQKDRQIDAMITEKDVDRVLQLEKQMKELTEKSEQLAEEGEVEQAQAMMSQVEKLKVAKEKIAAGPQGEKRMIVCEVSGNLMSNTDNEERIQAHFNGKMYIGWKTVREKVKELEEKERQLGTSGRSRSRDRDWRGGSRDHRGGRKERSRERDRSYRSRDGGGRRGRGDRSRERDSTRSRDRDSRRSSHRDRRKSDRRERSRDDRRSRKSQEGYDDGHYEGGNNYYEGGGKGGGDQYYQGDY